MRQDCIQELGRLRPQLVSFAMRRLRSRDEAEDAVQETLLAALEGIDRFSGDATLLTWLIGILKHKIVDCLRASGREQQPFEPDDERAPPKDSDPEMALVRKRMLGGVASSLSRLPPNAAQVFIQRAVAGAETHEVCRQLAISRSNCWVLLHRAKARLRACADLGRLAAEMA